MRLRRIRRPALALTVFVALAACTLEPLNPQPLPPSIGPGSEDGGLFSRSDASKQNFPPPGPSDAAGAGVVQDSGSDSGAPAPPPEADDAGDAGADAGEAGTTD